MLRQRDSTLVPNSAPPPLPFCPPPPLHGLTLEPGIQLGSLPDPCSAPHVGNTMCCHSAPRPAPAPGLSLGPLARPAHHVPSLSSLAPPSLAPAHVLSLARPRPPHTCAVTQPGPVSAVGAAPAGRPDTRPDPHRRPMDAALLLALGLLAQVRLRRRSRSLPPH